MPSNFYFLLVISGIVKVATMDLKLLLHLLLPLCCVTCVSSQGGCYNYATEGMLDDMTVTTKTWFSASVNGTTQNARIIAHMEWNVTKTEVEPDGYAVFFDVNNQGYSPSSKSLLPSNVCTRHGQFWVNARNRTVCDNVTSECQLMTSECLCRNKCPLFYRNGRYCEGSIFVELDGYFTVPSTVHYLEFDITSLEKTGIKSFIAPYYRQDSAFAETKVKFGQVSCQQLFNTSHYSTQDASELCCRIGIKSRKIDNITFGDPKPIFKENLVSMTISWMLPSDNEGLYNFSITENGLKSQIERIENYKFVAVRENWTKVKSCQNLTHRFQVTLVGVVPTKVYKIRIWPKYRGTTCRQFSPECFTDLEFLVPALDVCNKNFRYCDTNANCTAQDPSGKTSLNATCNCSLGYTGNGVNSFTVITGEGCVDTDHCLNDTNPCDPKASCYDNPAPLRTANCSCLSGYFGDGYLAGSGCSSVNTYALSIALPVTVVLLILLIGAAWMIRTRKLREENLKWSNFVSNSALQYSIPSKNKDDNVWLPTFGEQWEITRERIKLGDILGRGNYGVVYKGSLTPTKGDEVTEDIDIAVKFVKEGANQEEKISDFLTEIGFMLNVGEHPNVIKVVGCSTTERPILLITELLKYGDLLHFLWDAREPTKCLVDPVYHLTEISVYEMSRQVAQGMAYLTKSRIIHGDLAARNILIGEDLVCKISDFGLANDVYRYGVIRGQTERTVPFKWISPERMMSGRVPITSKSDVWSFGNLIYEMVTLGCMPHPGVSSDELFDKLKAGYRMKQPVSCGDNMYSIMKKCWKWRASSRPTFSDLAVLLSHGTDDDKKAADYVNIVKVVDSIDKEQYDKELDTSTEKTQKPVEDETKYKDNFSYYNKALMGDDIGKREFDKITDF